MVLYAFHGLLINWCLLVNLNSMELTCLSIQQPWAWCIFNAGKNIENRTWRTQYRGHLLIHASKKFNKYAYDHLQKNLDFYGIENLPTIEEFSTMLGGFVGMVDMVSCRRQYHSVWKDLDSYGWVLKNPITLNFVPYTGKLSLFKVELNQELKKQLGL